MRVMNKKSISFFAVFLLVLICFAGVSDGKELISIDFTSLRPSEVTVYGGVRDGSGWGPVVERQVSSEYAVIKVIPGTTLDVNKGTLELVVVRRKIGGSAYGHNTLFSFVKSDNKSVLTVYLVFEGEKGYLMANSPIGEDDEWGRIIPIPEPIPLGKIFHLAFTWGPDPVNDNKIYYNGQELKPTVGRANTSLAFLLAGADRIVVGADFGTGYIYPQADSPAVELKFVRLAVSDVVKNQFDLSAIRPVIKSVEDDTFSVPGISGKLVAGNTVHVTLVAEPGGTAWFDMGNVKGIPMTEDQANPGTYRGEYTIKPGDDFENGQIVGYFKNAAGVEANPVISSNRWTIDTHTTLKVEIDKKDLPADRSSRAKIKVTVTDANGDPVSGHHIRVDLATTEEYTGLVGAGDFGANVGASVEPAWKDVTDSWGEIEFDYTSGFAAKTVIVTAKDLDTGDVGVDYITSFIEAMIDIPLTRPISRAAARRGLLYYMKVEASRTELTADGRSRSVIRAYVYDPNGNPVEGDELEFTLDQANGTIRTIKAVTDKNGRAVAEYRAGKKVGIVTITAFDRTRGLTGYVSITLLPDAPAKIYLKARPETLPADGFSRADIEVKVTDINDNPNPDTEILFALVKGDGKLRYDRLVTDRFGEVTNEFTAGRTPGIATVKATVKSKVPSQVEIDAARYVLFAPYSDEGVDMRVERWFVKEGDRVFKGEPVCEYTISNSTFTLTAPYDLQVKEILVETWDRVEIGTTLAVVTPINN